ncbi:MAG: hypothetical protein JWM03_1984, partial [Rhodocyclales bacterium]|nr:hypothetical protein [Rhodocyclales bacterium]
MVQKKRNGVVRAAVVVVCLAALLPFVANGQLSATVKLGVDWLTAKVAEVGLLSNANSIANLHQQRSEAAQTLRLLATVPDALTQAVATAQDVVGDLDSETLARQLLARDPADIAAAPLLTELLKRQNQDGGFAGAVGYESHVVDTAWAVNALAQQGRGDGSEASRARAYLAGRVGDNGVDTLSPNGLSLAGSTRVIGASVASIALQTGSDAASITGAQKLSQYLRSAQGVDGGWQSDTLASAWALLALAPVSSDAAYKTAAQAFLTARQKADGSWDSDPFVTAIALRALSVRPAVTPGSATTGQVLGSVIDASSGQPLDGASVSLQSTTAGAIPVVVPSDASGAFNFSNLAAGAYQLNISRAGYQASGSLLNLSIGQKYDVGAFKLTALTTTGILKGVVTSKSTGSPLAGVTISISGSNAQTATTDSSGRFEFSALNPGSINVAATLSGYVAASGSATVVAGQTLVFSPLLYTTGSPVPTTGKFSGQIVDASSNVALDGVTVSLSGAASVQWTSSGGGVFTGDLAPGAYAVSYSKSGYTTVQQTFVLVAGSNVSAGVVKLKAALTQSSLKGHVLSDAGTPVSGAQVEIVGSQPLQFAKSAADGSYALAGLAGTRFDVRVSAAGYTSQFLTLQLDQAADVQRDFTLVAQQSGKLQFGALALDKGNVLAGIDISGSVVVQNTDSVPVQLSGLMLVQDQRGSNVATGAVLDDSGSVLGNFTLAAGETRTLYTKWNSAQFAPGMYQYIVRLVEPGSRSRAVPLGVTIAERGSLFVISEDKRIAGAVIVTPPVARAGTGSTIHLNVTLQNAGNATLVAQDYRIRIQDAATSAVVYETTATGAALPVAALAKLDFGTWPATVAGNYQVSASAVATDVAGSASNKLYVGDAGSATFTVDRSLVPTGNQSVHAKIAVTGQDVTTGAISDPLVPLIKAAIQKSVTFNDSAARTWTVNNGCQGCHIQTQALVGGETNRKLSTFDSLARATIMNNTTLNQTEYGTYNEGYYRGYARDLTMLGMWALGSYHDKTFIASSLKLAADWTVGTQEAGGRWYSERCDLWWCSNEAFTGTNLRSIIDTYKLLSAVAPEKVKTYSIAAKPDAIALSSTYGPASYGLANDSAGRTYLSFTAGTVVQLNGDGSIGTVWSGLNSPRGLAEFQGGMVVATSSGLYKLLPDGTQTKVNDVTTFDALLVSADGKYMFSNYYAANQIVRIDANWVNEVWASGGLLSGPAGMAMDDAGRLYVTNYSGSGYILRFNMDKSSEKVLEYAYGRTNSVIHRADGWYVAGDHGIFRLNEDWEGERVWTGGVTGQLYQLPGGRFVVVRNNGLMEDIESTTVAVAPSLASYLVAIDRATTWLMASDTSGSTDVFQLAQHLVGLGEARNFYLTTDVARANTISTKMTQIANLLRANVNADGGWGRYLGQGSDSMATAQVGFALDYTNPSPSDPLMRKAVELLLTQQEASGAWHTNIAATELAATSWVSIWLPVMLDRLGGIDTDLTVTTPTTSAATAFNPPPSAITPLADGSTSYKWSMTGVTSAGRNVEFDLALANLLPNEQRPAASSAFLTFKNSFDGSLVDSPIDIPKIKATAQLDLTSATDKAAYGSNSPVLISAAVINGAGLPTNASVQLQVFAPDGKLVSNLGTFATGSIGAGVTGSTNAVWNTGSSLLAPGYSVLATLFDANGNQVSQTSIPFDITSTVSQQISARVSTDRAIYNPRDTVYITDRATNLVANSVREGLSLRTVVLNPNGQVQ